MADEKREPTSDDFDTDGILAVDEHLTRNPKSWSALIADHGLDPEKASRAVHLVAKPSDDLEYKAAVRAFVLGLQFGAMRLEPIEYDPKQEDNCACILCVIRRAAEAGAEPEAEG